MIRDEITKKIGEAMKARDEVRLSTLRLLSSALNYEFIAKQKNLTEDEEFAVVKREIKKRKEAIEAYQKAGQLERAEKEGKELEILEEFMPEAASEEEIEALVEEVVGKIGKSPSNFGAVMKEVMGKLGSRADGSLVSRIVAKKLS